MVRSSAKQRFKQRGFTLVEMLLATLILLVDLVAIAQLVPASILLNYRNRMDSSTLVFAQRQMDQMLDKPITVTSFQDELGYICQLGNPAPVNAIQGNNVVFNNNQTLIDFASPPVPGFSFTYQDLADPNQTTYDVRWAVIVTGNGSVPASKRYILGVRQFAGNSFVLPATLDTMVSK